MLGSHLISHWRRTQSVVSLSSAEAELHSSVCGLSRLLEIYNLLTELYREEVKIAHYVDSTACKSIMMRRGAGAVKHLSTKALWSQEIVRSYKVEVRKVPRAENPADSLCSFSNEKVLKHHMALVKFAVCFLGVVS